GVEEKKDERARRQEEKDGRGLWDAKTTRQGKTEGRVGGEEGIQKSGGARGGSIATSASSARGFARLSYRQAGEAKATMTWRGEDHALSPAPQGWAGEEKEPAAPGETPGRNVAPPGATRPKREVPFPPS